MEIYVYDIIFGATNESLYKYFSAMMQNEFEMSMVGELWHFLELQIHQAKEETSSIKKSIVNSN